MGRVMNESASLALGGPKDGIPPFPDGLEPLLIPDVSLAATELLGGRQTRDR